MNDELKELAEIAKRAGSIHGKEIKSNEYGGMFSHFQKISNTPAEALSQARADSIKRNAPFKEKPNTDLEEADAEAAEKYIDDLLDRLI